MNLLFEGNLIRVGREWLYYWKRIGFYLEYNYNIFGIELYLI
jgi:hypothetical protein